MKKIRRMDAIRAGLNRYYTGEKCHRGHVAERRVSGVCVQCEAEDWHKKYGPKFREARKLRMRRIREETKRQSI